MTEFNIEKEIENAVKKYCDKNSVFDAELINCYKSHILQSLKEKIGFDFKYFYQNKKKTRK